MKEKIEVDRAELALLLSQVEKGRDTEGDTLGLPEIAYKLNELLHKDKPKPRPLFFNGKKMKVVFYEDKYGQETVPAYEVDLRTEGGFGCLGELRLAEGLGVIQVSTGAYECIDVSLRDDLETPATPEEALQRLIDGAPSVIDALQLFLKQGRALRKRSTLVGK